MLAASRWAPASASPSLGGPSSAHLPSCRHPPRSSPSGAQLLATIAPRRCELAGPAIHLLLPGRRPSLSPSSISLHPPWSQALPNRRHWSSPAACVARPLLGSRVRTSSPLWLRRSPAPPHPCCLRRAVVPATRMTTVSAAGLSSSGHLLVVGRRRTERPLHRQIPRRPPCSSPSKRRPDLCLCQCSLSDLPKLFDPCSPVKHDSPSSILASLAVAYTTADSLVCEDTIANTTIPILGEMPTRISGTEIHRETDLTSNEVVIGAFEADSRQMMSTKQTIKVPSETSTLLQVVTSVEDVVVVEDASDDEEATFIAQTTIEDPSFLPPSKMVLLILWLRAIQNLFWWRTHQMMRKLPWLYMVLLFLWLRTIHDLD